MARAAKAAKAKPSPTAARKSPASKATSTPKKTTTAPKRAAPARASKAPVPVPARKPVQTKRVAPVARLKPTAAVVKPKRQSTIATGASKNAQEALKAQIETLEKTVIAIRTKSRATEKQLQLAEARIADLEDGIQTVATDLAGVVALLQSTAVAEADAAMPEEKEIDPGDAVPPGVAVQEPAVADAEAEEARENLEEHLRDG